MKYLVFVVLLVVVVITTGCTGGSQNIPVTPSQTTGILQDPIIGKWEQKLSDTWTFTFTHDGNFTLTSSNAMVGTSEQTWSKIETNQYVVTDKYNMTHTITYHPETDTLTFESSPNNIYRIT